MDGSILADASRLGVLNSSAAAYRRLFGILERIINIVLGAVPVYVS